MSAIRAGGCKSIEITPQVWLSEGHNNKELPPNSECVCLHTVLGRTSCSIVYLTLVVYFGHINRVLNCKYERFEGILSSWRLIPKLGVQNTQLPMYLVGCTGPSLPVCKSSSVLRTPNPLNVKSKFTVRRGAGVRAANMSGKWYQGVVIAAECSMAR